MTHDVKVYKDELSHLAKKYAEFLIALNKTTKAQEGELKTLGDKFKEQEDAISKLTVELKTKTVSINDLHWEVDKENAKNINSKLTLVISTLIEIEKKWRVS